MPAGKPRPSVADTRPCGGVLAAGWGRLAGGERLDLKPGHSIKGKLSFQSHHPRKERSKLTTKRITTKRAVALAATGLLAAGLAACSSSSSSPASPATGSSSTSSAAPSNAPALVMESSPETSITQNFNPFVGSSPINGMGATGLVYEPLLQFDLANPSVKPYDWLATSYTWSNGGKTITFAIRQNVKWSKGN